MTKMLIDRATVEQALEALELYVPKEDYENRPVGNVIDALGAALAEPQEPDSPERRCGGPGCDGTCCQPVQEPDDKAASIRWQLCLLAQTEEFSDEVRNQIGRGVWLIDRLTEAALAEPQANTLHGWVFKRNEDGTVGIFAPPPRPGESQRTSDCVGTNQRDLNELLGKLADHMAALAEPTTDDSSAVEPAQGPLATMTVREDMGADFKFNRPHTLLPGQQFHLHLAPPQRKPLTDEQKQAIHNETGAGHSLICLVESYINGIKE